MTRRMLKSKIHRATVTDADLNYEGSISIDPVLMKSADILPHEAISIYNVSNGERFTTYAIEGVAGKGEIVINGAAAWKAQPGNLVILCTYAEYQETELGVYRPIVVYVDSKNRILKRTNNLQLVN